MMDLLIICLLSWSTVNGWQRGAYRSMVGCMGIGSAIAVVLFTVPFIKDRLVDGSWAWDLRKWMQDHMQAVPTSIGLSAGGEGPADKLYHLIVVGVAACSVWIGIRMILKVYETLWEETNVRVGSRIAGSLIGFCIGSAGAAYLVDCLGLLSWVKGWEALDQLIGQSVIVTNVIQFVMRF
ncbi:CvpA family protein [Effusibacillus dendaii]|uniref:CvpA family protein n=1 Tax=Effusibacillus dendaii TaxID=2743772 RepID=A0A7I8DF57_9BACL|nr:CvpA family protein [Effusibacillus dendaii]BCJ87496.1 hypothetical protein skT53_24810 [Effusibacillus dendaii]